MSCPNMLTTQAYFDGELDAAAALSAEDHIAACAECAASRQDALAIRKALREDATYYRASEKFRRKIRERIGLPDTDRASTLAHRRGPSRSPRSFLAGAFWGAAGAFAASLMIFLLGNPVRDPIVNDLVSAHIRSLIGSHLIDVASSDHHTVKPWFSGHSDVSPPVEDFAGEGFQLVGGRVDYVDGRRAAVTVYRHADHIVNVFAWRDAGDVKKGMRELNGYNLLCWKQRDLFICAASDADRSSLDRLAQLITKSDTAGE